MRLTWTNSPRPAGFRRFPAAVLSIVLFPALLAGQGLSSQGLSYFPGDTQQVTYSNLAALRDLPNYMEIRRRILSRQMEQFEMFLRATGTDVERDVDEVMLGWRGEVIDNSSFFGVATGRFQPERARGYMAEQKIPLSDYAGYPLYTYDAARDRSQLFFTFLDSSTAAFGRLSDLKAILDVHAGNMTALDSNGDFVGWQGELEDTAPQWGIATGKAAANEAGPWLAGGGKLPVDPKTLTAPINAVLYRVEWSSGFTARLSILCQTADHATALAQMITLWKTSRAAASNSQPGIAAFLQGLDVQTDGSRVNLTGSGPVELVGQVLHGPGGEEE